MTLMSTEVRPQKYCGSTVRPGELDSSHHLSRRHIRGMQSRLHMELTPCRMRQSGPAPQATEQTTDGIGEMITQYLCVSVSFDQSTVPRDGWKMETGDCYHSCMPHVSASLLYPCTFSGFQLGSCAVVVISCCNTVPVAPALPSQGPGLCAVPARGALAILRGHSGSALQQTAIESRLGGDLFVCLFVCFTVFR